MLTTEGKHNFRGAFELISRSWAATLLLFSSFRWTSSAAPSATGENLRHPSQRTKPPRRSSSGGTNKQTTTHFCYCHLFVFFLFYLFFIHNSFWGCYARDTRLSSKRASDSKLLINWYTYSRSAWGLRACCRYFCWVVFVSPIFFIKSTGLGFEPSLQSKCGAEDELKTI